MNLRHVDLNLIPILDALLEEESVTRAAQRVGLSVPAASRALGRLRDRLDDPLLVRAGKGMVRTRRGENLRSEVRTLIEQLDSLFQPRNPLEPHRLNRRFVIHATDHVLHVLGAELDRSVREQAPAVQIAYSPVLPETPEVLRDGRADVAIGVFPGLPPEFRVRTLFDDRFTCVLRRGHPLADRRLTLKRYVELEHVQIAPRGKPGGVVDRLLAERGLERRVARAVPYFLSALHLVAETDYVATMSGRLARALEDRLGLACKTPPLPFESYRLRLVWHPRHDGDVGHRWLREQLAAAAATV